MDGLLLSTAAGVAFLHTIMGPDHYLPFLMLASARKWSWVRTLTVAGICGLGHVAGSLLLGVAGLAIGASVASVDQIQVWRGDWAAWLLVAFGFAYAMWGLRIALRKKRDLQAHTHMGHVHIHRHASKPHGHDDTKGDTVTFWMLLLVFVLGPCEPLVPLFILPASRGLWDLALMTAVVFSVVTLVTMLSLTALGMAGLERLSFRWAEKWGHALAGVAVATSGLAVILFGL
jgi:nickel/cobalt exporter